MKFASYHLGNMVGLGITLDDPPKTKAALDGHWFAPFFDKLKRAYADIAADYGKWTDRSVFEALGDLADEIVADGGLTISGHGDDGGFYVDIPFTPETMPDAKISGSRRSNLQFVPTAQAHRCLVGVTFTPRRRMVCIRRDDGAYQGNQGLLCRPRRSRRADLRTGGLRLSRPRMPSLSQQQGLKPACVAASTDFSPIAGSREPSKVFDRLPPIPFLL